MANWGGCPFQTNVLVGTRIAGGEAQRRDTRNHAEFAREVYGDVDPALSAAARRVKRAWKALAADSPPAAASLEGARDQPGRVPPNPPEGGIPAISTSNRIGRLIV